MKNNKIKIIPPILLIIIIFILVAKNQYSRYLLNDASYGMPAIISMGNIDNLYIGSSMFRQGLDIKILEEELDGTNYILSYNGNQPVTELFELEYLVKNGVTINNLYIDMYAYSIATPPSISDDKIFLETDISGKRELWRLLDKHTIQNWWAMWVSSNNEQLLFWPINSRLVSGLFHNGGSIIETECILDTDINTMRAPERIESINMLQKNAILDIIDFCRTSDINICFIETPKTSAVISDNGYQLVMEEYCELLERVNVKYIKQDDSYSFDSSCGALFQDAIHLSSNGRRLFSKKLIDCIK